jgi:hypothetical protein
MSGVQPQKSANRGIWHDPCIVVVKSGHPALNATGARAMKSFATQFATLSLAASLSFGAVLVGMVGPAEAASRGAQTAEIALLPSSPVVWLPA